ncbi:MAG: hypothetical protein QOG71_174 [Pyrinomonadaceae bacterium]|jgi:hypothetical protein|nr:hypothetical protein [Pyrinomonadaceae bacterium]MDX6272645.1 hypothetical protein [Acidobacteriota bacterium]
MKRTPVVFNRLIIALALATQLFLLAPTAQATMQNNPPAPPMRDSVQHEGHDNMRATPRRNNRCRERCLRQYRQCLRGTANPNQARCRRRYRDCLRRCLR